ncbi:MAG: alpha/beta hydrolase [Bacillota bacterium]|nr:alpha/beta hydrolase [Bacillota bacterium]
MIKQVNGINVNYESQGNGEETIVFVHGLGGSLNIWYSQQIACSRHYQTLAYDLRGSGRSDLSDFNYSIELWVEDLKALLESENITKAHLVGWSLGTLIVQHFVSSYPDMVASQTLIGPLWELPEMGKKNTFNRANIVEEQGMDAVADTIIEGGLSAYSRSDKPALVGLVRELLLRNHPQSYAASCRALANGRAISHVQVEVPTLLIVGDEDKVTPLAMAAKLYQHFPNARLEVIANSGHWATVEKPSELNQTILTFLKTIKQSNSVKA